MAEASGTKSGAAGGADAQPARPVVRYRFTVSTPDNRRLTSAVAAVLLPPYLDGAQWSQAQVGPGEKATMSVKAPGREGEKLSFVVERRGPKEWEAVGNTSATVKDGSAQAVQEMPFLPPPRKQGESTRSGSGPARPTGRSCSRKPSSCAPRRRLPWR